MPLYQVWYQENDEPLRFTRAERLSDRDIVGRILEHESIAPMLITDKNRGGAGDQEPSLSEIIQRNNLAPVRYTMDESEMIVIS